MDEPERQNYCVTVTYTCNWDCSYCCTDTHSQPEPSMESILAKIDTIAPGSHTSLSGGEPGMLSDENMDIVLTALEAKQCLIGVNTNGLFFHNHKKHMHRIYDYVYHCSFDLRNRVYQPVNHEELDIDYVVVVTNEAYPRLKEFLIKNSHVKIIVYSADKYTVRGKPGEFLDHKHRIKLYQEHKHLMDTSRLGYLFDINSQTSSQKTLNHLKSI